MIIKLKRPYAEHEAGAEIEVDEGTAEALFAAGRAEPIRAVAEAITTDETETDDEAEG